MTTTILDHAQTRVRIAVESAVLTGDITIPDHAHAFVVLIDGGESPLHSVRDARVADALHDAGVGTFTLDLLTDDEQIIDEKTRSLRFDVRLLAKRLVDVTDWIAQQDSLRMMPIGYFAGDAAAGSALIAAAARPRAIAAIVCRGGRPDLASAALPSVAAPTLLLVGGNDRGTIPLNEWAFHRLSSPRELVLVDDATHLYESARARDEVCRLTASWFERYLTRRLNDDAVPDPEC